MGVAPFNPRSTPQLIDDSDMRTAEASSNQDHALMEPLSFFALQPPGPMVSLLIIHGFELKLASQGTRKCLTVIDGELTDRTYGSTILFGSTC